MKAHDVIKEVLDLRGMTIGVLAEKLGYSHRSGAAERLRGQKSMGTDVLIDFLNAIDCELVIRSKLKDKGEWVVTKNH